jgi:hypothetical protein
MNSFYKLVIVNIFLLSLILVGYFYGYVAPVFNNDISKITYLISFIIGLNIIAELWTEYLYNFKNKESESVEAWLDFIRDKFLYLGVAGTLIGFSHMMGGINSNATIQEAIESVKVGCLTLGNTTLAGIVGYLWVDFNFFLTRKNNTDVYIN